MTCSRWTSLVAVLAAVPALASAQESKAFFDAPVVALLGSQRAEQLANWNGDGVPDVLDVWWLDYEDFLLDQLRVRLLWNDGAGALSTGSYIDLDVEPAGLEDWGLGVGDLNGDGRDDTVLGYGRDMHLLFSPPGNGWQLELVTLTQSDMALGGPTISGVVIADFDQDGRNEFAVYNEKLRIYSDSGPGTPFTLVADLSTGTTGAELTRVETNGDGFPDLALTDATGVTFHSIVGGQIVSTTSFPHTAVHPMPSFGDIDGDGDEDFVVFDMSTYEVFRRVGPSSWNAESTTMGGPATHLIDIDLDGDLDGLCCGGGPGGVTQLYNSRPSIFRISLNDGTGAFAPATEMEGLGAEHLAGAADMDGDGDIDIVAGRCIYFAPELLTEGFGAPLADVALLNHQFLDLDGDSDPDLESSADPEAKFRSHNMGDATWEARQRVFPDAGPNLMYRTPGYPGDWDGDGDIDLLVERRRISPAAYRGMYLLLNNGSGVYSDGGRAAPAGERFTFNREAPIPRTSQAEDLDGDGDLDLVLLTTEEGDESLRHTRVWWNDGGGFFTTVLELPGEKIQHVADFNLDGLPDFIADWDYENQFGSALYSSARIHEGLGNHTFGVPFNIPSVAHAPGDRFDAADVDGDGDVDLCLFNLAEDELLMCWNDGAGNPTFTAEVVYDRLSGWDDGGRGNLLVDVNADGLLDIVAWGTGAHFAPDAAPNASVIFLGTANGPSFTEVAARQVFTPTAYADVDGDGDVDVFKKRLYKNRSFEGDSAGSRRQYGEGVAGSGGITPLLGEVGPLRAGEDIELRLRGALGGATGLIALSFTGPSPASTTLGGPGNNRNQWDRVYRIQCDGALLGPGAGSWSGDLRVLRQVGGAAAHFQAFVRDPAAKAGWSASNLLELIYR